MLEQPVRPATATTGRTVLAIVATLSLLLSFFALVRPALATSPNEVHLTNGAGASSDCGGGEVTWHFVANQITGGTSQSAELTASFTGSGGSFTASDPDGGLAVGHGQTWHFYVTTTGDATLVDAVATFGTAQGTDANLVLSGGPQCGPAAPDLTITKSADTESVNAGGSFSYTITVDNTGNADATGVVITDDLSDSLTIDSATFSNDGGTATDCAVDATDNTISCDVGTLAAGTSAVATIAVTTSAASCDEVKNTSSVVSNEQESENSNEVTVGVVCAPDLTITKSADATSVDAGGSFSYTITVDNTGNADATGVVITDDLSDSLTIDSATFSNDGGTATDCAVDATDNTISCDVGTLAAGTSAVATIAVTTSAASCDEVKNTSSVVSNEQESENSNEVTVGVVCADLGSITIHKVIDCQECETRTPGYWFNNGGSHDAETNMLMAQLAANDGGDPTLVEVNIDGTIETFATAQDVRDFLDADRSGVWDGQKGLSRDGALLRHFLATHLNLLLNGEDCDLGSRILGDQTVAEILEEAAAALAADDEGAEVAALEKLTAINQSDDAEENPLTCGDSEGTSGAGFSFELFGPAPSEALADSGTTDTEGTLVLDGEPDGTGLALGEYLLVETTNEGDLECNITDVIVTGGADAQVVLNDDGTVSITLTEANTETGESPDVVITVVNECEQPGEEEEFGSVLVAKVDEQGALLPDATFEINGMEVDDLVVDGLFCLDGLELGSIATVEETIAPDGYIGQEGVVNVTVENELDCDARVTAETTADDADEVFVNVRETEEGEGLLEIEKWMCEGEGETFFTDPSDPKPLGGATTAQLGGEDPNPCTRAGGVTFSIHTYDPETQTMSEEPVETAMTNSDPEMGQIGVAHVSLAPGWYVVVEDSTGVMSDPLEIVADHLTVISAFNFAGGEEETGFIKVIKWFCTGEEDEILFVLPGENSPNPQQFGCEAGAATFAVVLDDETDDQVVAEIAVGNDGVGLSSALPEGTYWLVELDDEGDPMATSHGTVTVTAGQIISVVVFNFEAEAGGGEQPGGGGQPGGEGTLGGNPVPNTAMDLGTGTLPAAVLALVMLSLLGLAGVAAHAEVRRRR